MLSSSLQHLPALLCLLVGLGGGAGAGGDGHDDNDDNEDAYLIFVIFSPHTQFFDNFFSTQKRVNRDKTDLPQKYVNCDKTNVTTKKQDFRHMEAFFTSQTCQMWRNFRFLHIFHMAKFEITPHVEKFQISPHLPRIEI